MIVDKIMTRKDITIKSDHTLFKAQELMVKNSIRHLPVVHSKNLEGIITESDILGAFISKSSGPKKIKVLDPKKLNIISVGMAPYAKNKKKEVYFFRLDLCETAPLVKKIEKAGFKVLNAID